MKRITNNEVVNKGLDWVRTLDEFEIEGNHYQPYTNILVNLYDEYNIDTQYFGSSDQGSTISKFTKKSSDDLVYKKLKDIISDFESRYYIKVEKWEIKDINKLTESLGL